MSLTTENPARQVAVKSPISEKALLSDSIPPRLPLVGSGSDQSEARSHVEQRTLRSYPNSLNGAIAGPHDEDRNVDTHRSSSLSDIGDVPDDNGPAMGPRDFSEASNRTDSEAETERLEQSPHKSRKALRVLLRHEDPSLDDEPNKMNTQVISANDQETVKTEVFLSSNQDPSSIIGTAEHGGQATSTSTTSPFGNGADDIHRVSSPPEIAGTKRKRTVSMSKSPSGNAAREVYARKRTGSIKSNLDSHSPAMDGVGVRIKPQSTQLIGDVSLVARAWAEDGETGVQDAEEGLTLGLAPPEEDTCRTKRPIKGKKGRKVKKSKPEESGDIESVDAIGDEAAHTERNLASPTGETAEAGEDLADMEGGDGGVEAALRSEEEIATKNSALESLSAIEKQFATFKDKLYDERLAQLNAELELLNQPKPTQSEYLAMMQCIDNRLIEKISHEQTLLAYKLEALEVKSVAERSQLHSQYFQDVRDIRDRKLEEVGEQWYQIQRDRRSWDGSVPDFMYRYSARRSQQITQQKAYNLEVSILSGVAKYVGFPAAPSILGARRSEIEDDLKSIGINTSPQPPLHQHTPPMSTPISRVSHHRPRPAAEEQFLEQTPWANPQHPAHHQMQQVQRQVPHQPRTSSPFMPPLGRKPAQGPDRELESSLPIGAAPLPTSVPPDVQGLVRSGQLHPRSSGSIDSLDTSDSGGKGLFTSIQQDVQPPQSFTYSASQTPIKTPTRLLPESIGAIQQPQSLTVSHLVPGTRDKAITSKSPVAKSQIELSRNSSLDRTLTDVFGEKEGDAHGISTPSSLGPPRPVSNNTMASVNLGL